MPAKPIDYNAYKLRFAKRLKKLRGKRSQDEVRQGIGVSERRLSQWENGKGMPNGQMLVKIANYFGIGPDEVMP